MLMALLRLIQKSQVLNNRCQLGINDRYKTFLLLSTEVISVKQDWKIYYRYQSMISLKSLLSYNLSNKVLSFYRLIALCLGEHVQLTVSKFCYIIFAELGKDCMFWKFCLWGILKYSIHLASFCTLLINFFFPCEVESLADYARTAQFVYMNA